MSAGRRVYLVGVATLYGSLYLRNCYLPCILSIDGRELQLLGVE